MARTEKDIINELHARIAQLRRGLNDVHSECRGFVTNDAALKAARIACDTIAIDDVARAENRMKGPADDGE